MRHQVTVVRSSPATSVAGEPALADLVDEGLVAVDRGRDEVGEHEVADAGPLGRGAEVDGIGVVGGDGLVVGAHDGLGEGAEAHLVDEDVGPLGQGLDLGAHHGVAADDDRA